MQNHMKHFTKFYEVNVILNVNLSPLKLTHDKNV